MEDDPRRRKPDISLAKQVLDWAPKVNLMEGLKLTVDYFRNELTRNENIHLPNDFKMHDIYYFTSTEEAQLKNKNDKNEL